MRRLAALAVVCLAFAACSSSTGSNQAGTESPTTSPSATRPSVTCPPSGVLEVQAEDLSFTPSCLATKAGAAFTVKFKNQDAGIQHSFAIYRDAEFTGNVFPGSVITGKSEKTYDVPALAAGTYHFRCEVHHTMTGTLIAA